MPAIMAEVTAHAILIKTILDEIRAAAMRAGFNISVIQKFDFICRKLWVFGIIPFVNGMGNELLRI